ncbi:MAG: hypothetical protein HY854_13425 [Burkholderiales bacterium]|nr:hypothetical protein [Burkholderiales bacterium]
MPNLPNLPNPLIQQCEVKELDDDSGWDRWQELAARQDARFAQTVPGALPVRPDTPAPVMPLVRAKTVAVDEVLLLARKNNRVCPLPDEWQRIYQMLPDTPPRLVRPLVDRDWAQTSSLAKRMVLRDQIEWAASAGLLGHLRDLLAELPEESWHHMGQ